MNGSYVFVSDQEELMCSRSLLSRAMYEIIWCGVICPLPRPLQAESTQGKGPQWRTPRRFHCSHVRPQMLDSVHKHLSCTVLLVSFSRGAILQYLVYLVLIVIIFYMLSNHNKRIKPSVRINHISLATFAIVQDSINMWFLSDHVSYLHLHVKWVTEERFEFQISWQDQKSILNDLPASAYVGLIHAINHDL